MTTTEQATITVHLDRSDALRLIGMVGTRNPRGGFNLNGDHYWQTDEALLMALRELAAANGVDIG